MKEKLPSLLLTPQAWLRFVDDTWVIQQQAHKQGFLDHINSIDPAIKFIVEGNQANGAIPSLDTLVTPLADNSLSFQVYQKPTHTDQYLQWESHHSLSSKHSVIGTLTHRAKVVCTTPELLKDELKHLREAKPLASANILTGPLVGCKIKLLIATGRIQGPQIATTTAVQVKKTMAPQTTTT